MTNHKLTEAHITLPLKETNPISFLVAINEWQKSLPQPFEELQNNQDLIQDIQDVLKKISTEQLLDICSDNEPLQNFLITVVFLQKEDELYRVGTERENPKANWSDKLMSLVGSLDGKDILTGVLNHLGDVVRTKKDVHYKAAEAAEIRAVHAEFLDGSLAYIKGRNNEFELESEVSHVMSEVADGIYNLTQLIAIDPNEKSRNLYSKYLKQLDEIYGSSRSDMLLLVIAKYHYRMYNSKNGANQYSSEDKLVLAVLERRFPEIPSNIEYAREVINKSYQQFDKIFAKLKNILIKRFQMIYKELNTQNQSILNKIFRDNLIQIAMITKNTGAENALILKFLESINED